MANEDPLWTAIGREARREAEREPILASALHAIVLNHATLEEALSYHLAGLLAGHALADMALREVIEEAFAVPEVGAALRADLRAVPERDAATQGHLAPLLYYKGFHALESSRVAHWLWQHDRKTLALHLQSRISQAFALDIHPAARIGKGIFVDHGTGIVIGETAVVEDDVSMLHAVTLGGTGKETGDRHPKIRRGVLISAGAKVLGNVEVGEGSKVGAGSVVLQDVPPHSTAVGIPARILEGDPSHEAALEMDQSLPLDYAI